jgi:hypothetical protein
MLTKQTIAAHQLSQSTKLLWNTALQRVHQRRK